MSHLQRLLLHEYASAFAERVALAAVAALQASTHRLSGDDSGLHCTWDEICVQVQGDASPFWDAYEIAIEDAVRAALIDASKRDLVALWLRTDEGWDWHYDHEHSDAPGARDLDIAAFPVDDGLIVRHIAHKYILRMAGDDDRPAVRDFLDMYGRG